MKTMLIGKTGSGKTTLKQKINDEEEKYHKTQMVYYEKNIIDTPGEYIENRGFYKVLNVVSTEAELIIFVQSALDDETVFPPNFASMFGGKKVIGVITKTDLTREFSKAKYFLENAGAKEIYFINKEDSDGIEKLRKIIEE